MPLLAMVREGFSCRPVAVFNVYLPKTRGVVDQRFMPEKPKETGWLAPLMVNQKRYSCIVPCFDRAQNAGLFPKE